MRKKLPFLFVGLGMVFLAVAGAYFWHLTLPLKAGNPSDVPQSLAGVALSQVMTGEEAIRSINQLHGKEFPLEDGSVAVYGSENATLWISVAADDAAARELTDQMVARIAEGDSPFTDEGAMDIGGVTLYALTGLGQHHFYWQSGNLVLWVAADDDIASDVLHEAMAYYK
jgi:hypothetical protein